MTKPKEYGPPRRDAWRADQDLVKLCDANPGRTGHVRTFRRWAGCVCQWRRQAVLNPKA